MSATSTDPDSDLRLLNLTKAASELGISRPTLYRLIEAGHLTITRVGSSPRIRFADLRRFAETGTNNAA